MNSITQMIPQWAKAIIRQSTLRYWQASWRSRCLPDFIIIGAQKAGTTSLFHYLGQHPDLIPSHWKEVHFFDGGVNPNVDVYQQGPAYYQAHFQRREKVSAHQKTFEASPLYLYNPIVPGRIFDMLPNVKLIAMLRDPVERAISHYFHTQRSGCEPLSMLAGLQAEESRLEQVLAARDYKHNAFRNYSYKSRGLYSEQLRNYLDYFPKNNLLIVNSEKFFAEPHTTLRDIFEFLDVDPSFTTPDLKAQNVGSNRTQVDPAVRDYLTDYFREPNRELYELIGEEYDW